MIGFSFRLTNILTAAKGFGTVIMSLLRNGALPPGSTNTNGSAYIPAWNGAGAPYLLTEIDTDEATLPGFRRATTVAEGARLGEELVDNGDFATGASWVTGAGVSISGGRASFVGVADAADSLYQLNVSPEPNLSEIFVTYTISNYSSGGIFPTFGGSVGNPHSGTVRSANGTYTDKMTVLANKTLIFKSAGGPTTLDIDDVSTHLPIPTWLNDDNLGNPLHPTDARGNLLAYPPREDSTTYAEGDRIAQGRHYYEVTTAGTTAASAPDFNITESIDFTDGWLTLNTTDVQAVEFTTSAAGGVYKNLGLTPGNTYLLNVANCSTTASGFTVVDSLTASTPVLLTGNGTITYTAASAGIYFRNNDAGTFTPGQVELIGELTTDGTVTWERKGHYTPMAGVPSWPSTTNKVECDSVPTEVVGSDVVTNGGFDTDTNWTKGTGVTISGGLLSFNTAASAQAFQGISQPVGTVFEVTYTVLNYVSGSVRVIWNGSSTPGITRNSNGTYTERLIKDNVNNNFGIISVGPFVGDIDNVSVKLVTNAPGTYSFHNGSTFVQNIPGLTLSGDAAAILSIVDGEDVSDVDWGDGTRRDLSELNESGVVYKLDNSAGVGLAFTTTAGSSGNISSHSFGICGKTPTGEMIFGDSTSFDNRLTITSAEYVFARLEAQTPNNSSSTIIVRVEAGHVAYFFIPHLVQSSALPLPVIPTVAGSNTTLTATNPQVPTSPYLREQNCGMRLLVRPNKAGQTAELFDIGTVLSIAPTTIDFGTLSHSYTHAADTSLLVDVRYSTEGRGIRTREIGGSWSAWSEDAVTTGVTLPTLAAMTDGLDGSTVAIKTYKAANVKAVMEGDA